MKVLFYLYRYPGLGGIETITTLLANYLHDNGIDVCFFAEVVGTFTLPLNPAIKFFHSVGHNRRKSFHDVLINENVDVVVLHDNYDADAETIIEELKLLQIPLIVQEHSDPMGTIAGAKRYVEELKVNNIRDVLWRIKNFNYVSKVSKKYLARKTKLANAACRYVLLSKRFENSLKKCLPGMDTSKILAINNPLTISVNSASLHKKEKKIVFISRFEGVKRIDDMATIFRRCAEQNQDWYFEIYGDGTQKKNVVALSDEYSNIFYKGVTNNVAEVLETATILIMTSSFEGWGLVLTEAMASGCIPMAFDSYLSVRDIIEDGVNGVLVTPFDLDEYCMKLQNLIESDDLRKGLAINCIEKSRQFDIKNRIGKQWIQLLKCPKTVEVAIASSNRSHLLDVARELSNIESGGVKSYSVKFYTFTPNWRLKNYNINMQNAFSLFRYCILGIIINRFFPSEFSRELQRRFLDWSASFFLKKCDVLICQSPYFGRTMHVAREKYSAKIILDRGSTHVRKFRDYASEYSKHIMPEWYMRLDENQYAYADFIAIASEHVKNSFIDYNIPEEKLFVNPYGFDNINFYPTEINKESYVYDLIFVGQWSERKGCRLLIELCRKYGYSLLHVGSFLDIPFPSDMENLFHVDSVPESSLIDYYKRAKVFILLSYDEGLSLVQAQAISCGLPLVTSPRTGGRDLRDFVDKSEYIIEFDKFAIEEIHEAVEYALNLANKQVGIRNYAGVKVRELNWHSYANRYDKFIKKILL